MKVVFTAQAQEDLRVIGDYIAGQSPERALSIIDEIEEACHGLAHHPERFPLLPRHAGHGVRKRVFGRYLIFCRIAGDRVDILHILHGAAELDALL